MKYHSQVTLEIVREFLRYNPETGDLFWRERDRKWFANKRAFTRWNNDHAGKIAGTKKSDGYIAVKLNGKQIPHHRLAWAIFYGNWPKYEIDHINGARDDNRIANLRDVNRTANGRNLCLFKTNTTGHTGVYFNRQSRNWYTQIKKNGRMKHLGVFKSKLEAANARKKAEQDMGYHGDHGKRPSVY